MASAYSLAFYEELENWSRTSASVIVPLVLSYVPAKSVIDLGCGTGIWLSTFLSHGVSDIVGVDGKSVPVELLVIHRDSFRSHDLRTPYREHQRYDLAMSLEVAEHLPPSSADLFVESLTLLANVVLFSAAIPGQGGHQHLNEQWPDYWVSKFSKHGYIPVDCLRFSLWAERRVAAYYAQNIMFFVKASALQQFPQLADALNQLSANPLPLVHPEIHLAPVEQRWWVLMRRSVLPEAVRNRLRWMRNTILRRN